jgi:hypothetical protein
MIWWLTGYTAMALAAESEWIIDKGKILDDFQKLMFLKSPLKLFIYQTRSAEQSREFREAIENEMRAFVQHVKGEHYVLFEVAAGNAAHGYRYTAPITGETQSVRFEEIMGSPMSFEWETQNT